MEKIFIKTFGCSLNKSDSEVMAGLLEKEGYKIVDDKDKADLVIINTCTVKGPTERSFYRFLKNSKGKKIIVAGCIPQADPELEILEKYSLIGVSQLNKIGFVVEETLKENKVRLLKKEHNARLNLPKVRKNPVVEIIPICEGCIGSCAYCKVKQARGNLFSYDKKAIVKQAKDAVKDNVKEIWLTSQDNGCYGLDINTNIIELLNEVLKIKGDYKIRLGMINPNFALKFLDDLIETYKDKKMFKFLHIPVQSGNDRILKLMERKYNIKDFRKIVDRFRKEIPDITIATDIICGFPTETEEEFMNSYNLMKDIRPDAMNINMFWPRSKTKAAEMEQILSRDIKERTRKLTRLFHKIALENNKKWIGWGGYVLVDEFGKNNSIIARNYAYKQVILKGNYKLGDEVKVKIKKATKFDLRT
jgi:threonylcarbamoyladenosine tRNA methylthiotransferase CDKAL1